MGKPSCWAYIRKFLKKKSNNKIRIKLFFFPQNTQPLSGVQRKQALLQIAPSAVKWRRTILHWIPIKRLQLYNIKVGVAIFSADPACWFCKEPNLPILIFAYSEVPKQKNSLSFSIKSLKLDCRQVSQPCRAKYVPGRDIKSLLLLMRNSNPCALGSMICCCCCRSLQFTKWLHVPALVFYCIGLFCATNMLHVG